MSEDKRLFLLDGHALVYRAHYAFITRPLINSQGCIMKIPEAWFGITPMPVTARILPSDFVLSIS